MEIIYFHPRERRLFSALFGGSGIGNLISCSGGRGGHGLLKPSWDMMLKTGAWFLWFSCDGQQKVSKMEVKIFLAATGSNVNLHWIFSSSGQARIWPLNAYTLLHCSSLTQDLSHNFKGTISWWITPLCSLHLTFIFVTFWEHDCFTAFQSSASSEGSKCQSSFKPMWFQGSAPRAGCCFSTWCCGTPVQEHHKCSQIPAAGMAALHLPPCLHGSRAAQTGPSFKWGFMACHRRLHQSFVSPWWNLHPAGWDA